MPQIDISQLDIHARLMAEEAKRRGYHLRTIDRTYPINTLSPLLVVEKDDHRFLLSEAVSHLSSYLGRMIAMDKIRTYDILASHHLPIPKTFILRRNQALQRDAIAFLEDYAPIVVKPSNTNHGDGITIGISHEYKLQQAVDYAHHKSSTADILLQQTAMGQEYRFLVLGTCVIAVANRRPPSVVGDGRRTIEALIDEANTDPRRGGSHLSAMSKISKQEVAYAIGNERLSEVLANGQRLEILKTSNLSRGGEATNYTDAASDTLKDMAVRAAQACFLEFAGVDIMTTSIDAGDETNSVVIEVNVSPGIRMHQLPAHGTPIDVAAIIFDYLEARQHTLS